MCTEGVRLPVAKPIGCELRCDTAQAEPAVLQGLNLLSFAMSQVCVVQSASLRLAGQKRAVRCALDPPVYWGVALRTLEKIAFIAIAKYIQALVAPKLIAN